MRSLVTLHDKLCRINLIFRCNHANFLCARSLINISCYVKTANADKILSLEQTKFNKVGIPRLTLLVKALLNFLVEGLFYITDASGHINRFLAR